MSRGRITDQEREQVRQFIEGLFERWSVGQPKVSYAEFARQAGVNYGSLNTWRGGAQAKKKATPEAYEVMKMLRAAGVIGERFEISAAPEDDLAAEEVSTAVSQTEETARQLLEVSSPLRPQRKRESG